MRVACNVAPPVRQIQQLRSHTGLLYLLRMNVIMEEGMIADRGWPRNMFDGTIDKLHHQELCNASGGTIVHVSKVL